MNLEINEKAIINVMGAIALSVTSYLTLSTRIPSIFSPFSLNITLPALILPIPYLSLVIIPIYFLCWSYELYPKQRPDHLECIIPKRSLVLVVITILCSLFWLLNAWGHGVEYQGKNHTLMMYAYNFISWLILLFLYSVNKSKGTFRSSFAFHWMFFAWLSWVSFPWLGELP